MAKKSDAHWMEEAFRSAHGQLRAKTHTKPGQDISQSALTKAEHSKSTKERREANLAEQARKANHKKG